MPRLQMAVGGSADDAETRRPADGRAVMSEGAAADGADVLRKVVSEGTASFGEGAGYAVGGKTGTADKPKPRGGYYEDKVIAPLPHFPGA